MIKNSSGLDQIRRIDNSRRWLPFTTTLLVAALIFLAVWFIRGGSFRLYASIFFSLYFLTKRIWISVILIGILQNLALLPLRFISLKLSTSLKNFETALNKLKSQNEQYFLFNKKVKEGDPAVVFYIFNFVLNAIAFISAGRVFLIDFYSTPLKSDLIYSWVPYPQYPLKGILFNFPFVKITDTTAMPWSQIIIIWLIIIALFTLPRLIWRLVRFLFKKNQQILSMRINYNRLLLKIGSIGGTLFLLSLYILRHLPTAGRFILLTADLSRPNRTLNIITAIGTFITTFHAGHVQNSLAANQARRANLPEDAISKIYRQRMRQSFQNAIWLGLGAFLVTSQIPSAFELSVATFEVLYILSPYTFDHLLRLPAHLKVSPSNQNDLS